LQIRIDRIDDIFHNMISSPSNSRWHWLYCYSHS